MAATDDSPNLFTLFLRAMLVPMGAFAVVSVVARLGGSQRWVALAAVAGFFLVVILASVAAVGLVALVRRLRRREAETEFGVTPPSCAHCGYDLRASPDHCPECGHRVDPLDRTIIRYLMSLRRKP